MKKTIFYIARALPCFFYWRGNMLHKASAFLAIPEIANARIQSSRNSSLLRELALLAKKEIILEMLNRKRSIWLSLVFIVLSCSVKAQKQDNKLSIGDKVTDVSFTLILNYKETAVQLSQLKGKPIILDFWATYCTACLKHFPKLDSLQKKFGKNLQIFLVDAYSKDSEQMLSKFLQKQKESLPGFRLPVVKSTENLREMFPVKNMPHYIWIGSDGRIKSVTGPDEVTEPNIKLLIAGLGLNLKNKIE